jgi:hypothetical protein
MQEPFLKFRPSPRFSVIQSAIAAGHAIDPSSASELFGKTVAAVFQSESICSMRQMGVVLKWVVQQAERCNQHLQCHPLKLLPSLRALNSERSSSHVALSTSLCCQLLCGMFLDCFDEGSRPAEGNWPPAIFTGMCSSDSESCRATLQCVLLYATRFPHCCLDYFGGSL